MASEDHDYDEIKYFRLYGKKHTWETTQTGAVGRFNPESIAKLFSEIPGDIELFKKAIQAKNTECRSSLLCKRIVRSRRITCCGCRRPFSQNSLSACYSR
jgi:hypothetical protein